MRHKNLDLLVTMGIVIVSVVWTLLPYHISVVGVILALLLVFGLPGYTLTQALTHKRPLEPSHTLVFSLGLSLAIDVLDGFALNLLPAGLQATSWIMSLGLLTVVFSLLTVYFRRGIQEAYTLSPRLHFTIRECMMFGSAIIIAALAVVYSARGVIQQPRPGFTQFWMLPSHQPNNSCVVQLGIRNFEATPMRYSVVMTINGAEVNPSSFISLAPEQQWEKLVPISFRVISDAHIEARLYRSDKPKTAYRTTSLALSIYDLATAQERVTAQCAWQEPH